MGLVTQLQETFKNKKVFLTGHTGFKGAWLIMLLHELGAVVKGYALTAESDSLYASIEGDTLCTSVIHDIRDLQFLKDQLKSFQPDFIFHLAAQPLVRFSYKAPLDTFEVNVMGTANVLEAMRELSNACTAVLITTDKVYKNLETGEPFKEDDALGGYDPYSASKAAAEIVISSYRDSFFNSKDFIIHKKSIASARAGNVIGGGDWSEDRLIPDIIKAILAKENIVIRNPKAVRPWQHVIEPLIGYLTLAMKQSLDPTRFNEGWNFGPQPDNTKSVEAIVSDIIKNWGEGTVQTDSANHVHEAQLLRLDITKAERLGWKPILNSEATIQWTTVWYRKVKQDHVSPSQMVNSQIQDYFKLLE